MPSLSTFIRRNNDQILTAWDAFARDLRVGSSMTDTAVRDHAKAMLDVIADDLESPQTDPERDRKSTGASDSTDDRRTPETAAAAHGSGRAVGGFSPTQMVAEFRALRASVTDLWVRQQRYAGPEELYELIRFNEAIDQAIAESLARYTADVERTQGHFLAILGHDLRTPLGAIVTSTQFVLDTASLSEPSLGLVKRVSLAARRMNQLVADLLDLALTRFGDSIPVTPAPMEVDAMLHEACAEVAAYYPASRLEVDTQGDLKGEWDDARLTQAFVNILSNAVQHGTPGAAIAVSARGEVDAVCIAVRNDGPSIPTDQLARIFRTPKTLPAAGRDRRHLGLGLYIVEKIVSAHDGTISVESSAESGTLFTVRLPRRRRPAGAEAGREGRRGR